MKTGAGNSKNDRPFYAILDGPASREQGPSGGRLDFHTKISGLGPV
ncbi:hypothetical protein SAMN06296036_11318 [Pseudobacteriovorax antillogorgiicola]|uniref:Uncharacterized protein n=1 Tax=Pseudobacteriovorax antillogorgiicola TaxID=1513793 RepID=A0A1Y6C499_9BACT|nr:hypothetical protein EDD56_11419 [Pseudobacteriovorax antillogorgiicola]SMF42767.1 hypothetical protein SAMN06296036_11318 [Pseudobacteriovorax antillogorgiicola]